MQPETLANQLRAARSIYDLLSPGERSVLRRCKSADDVLLEGAFWRLVEHVPRDERRAFAPVVSLFPVAPQTRRMNVPFRLGTHLRRLVSGKKTIRSQDALRFRQLVQSEDREEVVHRLRRLLTQVDGPVDWGVVGTDVIYWSDVVRRRWTQDFFAPFKENNHDEAA